MDLTSYRTLGHSGLIVSPLALGTMTFGTPTWGVDEAEARAIFENYVGRGGNFIDTADMYANGQSEEMLGRFFRDTSLRDQIVLATKFTWNTGSGMPGSGKGSARSLGNPNAGGNGRKNIHRALDASLKRLNTEYVDLYWLHFWDMVTPVEEVLETLVNLVRVGKIRYYALSDVPAWYMTRMATLANERGLPAPIALQTQYSLVERSADYEHIPAARELGIAVQPWSPLAGGFLTGKYHRENGAPMGKGRLAGDNPLGQTPFSERNWAILDVLREVATETGRSPADVSLAWAISQPSVASVLTGASRREQLDKNVAALELNLTAAQRRKLDDGSQPAPGFPWSAFIQPVRESIFGGNDVRNVEG